MSNEQTLTNLLKECKNSSRRSLGYLQSSKKNWAKHLNTSKTTITLLWLMNELVVTAILKLTDFC